MAVGFDVYGHFSLPCGLRVSADNTVGMLRARGAAVRLHDVRSDSIIGVRELGDSADYRVSIFHLNPNNILRLVEASERVDFGFKDHLNVCVPFWELPHVPDFWLPVLRGMDLVLAPTQFVADAIIATDTAIAVQHFPQTVTVAEGIEPQRSRFGLPEGVTIFGTSFAAQAVIERKNPWAVIEAFRIAFPQDQDVRLVVRAYDAGGTDASPTLQQLREAAAGDARIMIVSERLDYDDVMALYASYDAFVSLHRSEGLGLGPMEAMMVGTPVVATNWSGVLDFMDESNSCLVDYRLVPVEVSPESAYGSDSVTTSECWAEPDVHHAARLMRRLNDEPGWRRRLGVKAKQDLRERHQRIVAAPFVDDLISLAGRLDDPPYGHRVRAISLSRIQKAKLTMHRVAAFKRAVVRVLRALRLKPPAPEGEVQG